MALLSLPETVWWSARPLCPSWLSFTRDQTHIRPTAPPPSPFSLTDGFPNETTAGLTPLACCPLLGEPKRTGGSEQRGRDLSAVGLDRAAAAGYRTGCGARTVRRRPMRNQGQDSRQDMAVAPARVSGGGAEAADFRRVFGQDVRTAPT